MRVLSCRGDAPRRGARGRPVGNGARDTRRMRLANPRAAVLPLRLMKVRIYPWWWLSRSRVRTLPRAAAYNAQPLPCMAPARDWRRQENPPSLDPDACGWHEWPTPVTTLQTPGEIPSLDISKPLLAPSCVGPCNKMHAQWGYAPSMAQSWGFECGLKPRLFCHLKARAVQRWGSLCSICRVAILHSTKPCLCMQHVVLCIP